MNVEVIKMRNGYMVKPIDDSEEGNACYVFENYESLCETLKEILDQEEAK